MCPSEGQKGSIMEDEYQEIILNTILEKLGNKIDENTITNGEIKIGQVLNGICNFQEKDAFDIHLIVTYGTIFNICYKDSSEVSIDFTVYEFLYPAGLENQVVCNLKII